MEKKNFISELLLFLNQVEIPALNLNLNSTIKFSNKYANLYLTESINSNLENIEFSNFLAPFHKEVFVNFFQQCLTGNIFKEIDIVLENHKLAEMNLIPIINDNKEIESVICIMKDKTIIAQLKKSLIENVQISILTNIAPAIAHGINNPLEGIKNYFYLIHKTKDNQKKEKYISTIEEEMKKLAHIVKDIVIVCSPITEQKARLDFHKIIRQCLFWLAESYAHKDLNVKLSFTKEKVFVRGYEIQIKQTILYLLNHIMFYIPDKESIYIKTIVKEKTFSIIFEDNGLQLDRNTLDTISKPFHLKELPLESKRKPAMFIINDIMHFHDGTAEITNREPTGIKITLNFPIL